MFTTSEIRQSHCWTISFSASAWLTLRVSAMNFDVSAFNRSQPTLSFGS